MWMLALCLVVHFVADFLLQSREMGKNKSTDFMVLLQHLGIQFVCFFIFPTPVVGIELALCFSLANAIVHGVIDWNIWRGYKLFVGSKLQEQAKANLRETIGDMYGPSHVEAEMQQLASEFKYWEDHWFYTTIGLDQLLHTLS